MRLALVFALTLASCTMTPAPAATLQATSATFSATLAKARGGDTIVLSPDVYGVFGFTKATYSPPLIVTGGRVDPHPWDVG